MTKRFIGVSTKLLMLVVGALLLLSAGFSALSLSRLNQEFEQYQLDTVKKGQAQFELHNDILIDKLHLWLESFADVIHIKEQPNFISLGKELASQFDALQLHYNVENLWVVDDKNQILFSSSPLPAHVDKGVNKVLEWQAPDNFLHCDIVCEQLVFVPILNAQGHVAVVALSVSMVDTVYAINQTLNSDMAIISYGNLDGQLHQAQFVSASNIPLMRKLFAEKDQHLPLSSLVKQGLLLDIDNSTYFINLLSLAKYQGRSYYLALIDNVTSSKEQHQAYRRHFILSATIIFITLAIMVYIVASPFTKRLLTLSGALALLPKKEFKKFRETKISHTGVFSDELDILAEASQALSYELEQLNNEVEQKTQELENIAMYDLLTGLPNRNMLNYQLRKALAQISRNNESVAVLFLDLDDFKKVNDSNGHREGDRLLIEAANRVRLGIRNVDVACRFGGDEFVVILNQMHSINDAVVVAEHILDRFKQPIKIGSCVFYVSVSIGIAFTHEATTKPGDLISHADIAMYEAKDNGGGQYNVYHEQMYQRVSHRVMLETEVRQALASKQFSLALQPQFTAKDKKLYGFEALLRWPHPERGMISPDDFIPILENSEYMLELGYWVIRRSFEHVVDLKTQGLTDIQIAINLSASQFMDVKLPQLLSDLLTEFSLTADSFELELTEQTLVKDIDNAIATMEKLKALGFRFAIDDFGTGYSSLAYLKRMPVDVIKIDKSFVFGMLDNHADYQIIMSTIAMVKNLGLTVIAEGVESSAQLRCLTENDCDLIQGYYFSKPIPEEELAAFINDKLVDTYWKVPIAS